MLPNYIDFIDITLILINLKIFYYILKKSIFAKRL